MKSLALDVTKAIIAAGCPQEVFTGVRVTESGKDGWDIFFLGSATVEQVKIGTAALDAFDLNAWKSTVDVEEPDLATQLLAYLASKDPGVVTAVSAENLRAANVTLTAAGQEAILAAVSQPIQPIGKLS